MEGGKGRIVLSYILILNLNILLFIILFLKSILIFVLNFRFIIKTIENSFKNLNLLIKLGICMN